MSAEVKDLANKNARCHRKVKEQVEDFHQMAELNEEKAMPNCQLLSSRSGLFEDSHTSLSFIVLVKPGTNPI